MNPGSSAIFGILALSIPILTCTNPLKEPPGGLSGRVYLLPTPPIGEDWAYIRAYNGLDDDTVRSDPNTNRYSFTDLKVSDLAIDYNVEAFRQGYISHRSVVSIRAGATLVNYDIYLNRGARRDTSFQDGIKPSSAYTGCRDTYISASEPDSAHGLEGLLVVSGGNPDSLARGLIHFDFNWQEYFPPMDTLTMEIEYAVLSIFIDSVRTQASVDVAIYTLLDPFDETAATWNSDGSGPWPGGPGASQGAFSSDTLTVSSISFGWHRFDVKDIADLWLESSQPGAMMIKLVDESRRAAIFCRSSDSDSTALHPELQLAINYLE